MNDLHVYLPRDRRDALARGIDLPDRTRGTALFADLSGFTALTETLARTLGPRRGAEVLADQLQRVYTPLIAEVHRYGGSVIGFSGDAITCWFDGDDGERGAATALAMQRAIAPLSEVALPMGERAALGIKAAFVSGPARRFVVGDPEHRRMDVIAGRTLDALAAAEKLAETGEVIGAFADGSEPDADLRIAEWRDGGLDGFRFAVVAGREGAPPVAPLEEVAVDDGVVRPWLLPPIYRRLQQLRDYQGDFRPAAALFLSFRGIDFDADDEAGSKLDAFIRWLQGITDGFGGSLIQLTIGDKGSYLYLSFGAPVAHDDDAVRAVGCGLALRRPPFAFVREVAIGISHGHMYAGAYGSAARKTYGVLGAKTNLAARLMGRAEPGQILCDDEAASLAERVWRFERLPSIRVKGARDPVAIATPLGTVASIGRRDAEQRPPIGRSAERAQLGDAADALVAGRGGVLWLQGPAGIGKTRLLETLIRRLVAAGATALLGSAQQLGRLGSYRGWRDLLRALFTLDDPALRDAPPEQLHEHLAETLQRLTPQRLHRLPLLADVLGIPIDDSPATAALEPTLRQDNLFELLSELLIAESRRAPLLLVLDDAHDLDSLSWELAQRVVADADRAGAPLLLALAARPLDRERAEGVPFEGLLASAPGSALELIPLDADATLALAAERLGAAPDALDDALVALVRDRSGGNPLFVEELVRTLIDRELLTAPEGGLPIRLHDDADLEGFELPSTLQGLILARLDRLEPDEQLLLKVAAAVGREFTPPPVRAALRHFSASPEPFAERSVGRLTQRDFIALLRRQPELIYAFTHLMTHEVLYLSLLFSQRRRIHRAVAEWFELAYGDALDEHVQALAHHWGGAAEGSDDEGAVERAVGYLIRAGERSSFLGAQPEAIASFSRASSLLPEGERWDRERAKLQIHLGEAHNKMSSYAEAIRCFEAGLALAERVGDDEQQVLAQAGLGFVHFRRGDYDEAERSSLATLETARGSGDDLGVARALSLLGVVAAYRNDLDGAREHLQEGLQLYREHEHRDGVANNLNTLGVVALFEDDLDTAQRYFDEALQIARDLDDRDKIGKYLANLALVAENRGDLDRAAERYGESLVLFEEISARQDMITNTLSLGDIAAARERDDEARRLYLEVLPEALALDALPIALLSVRGVAWAEARSGAAERAAELLGTVLEHPARNTEVDQQVEPVLELIRERLDAALVDAALARGGAVALETLADRLLAPASPGSATPAPD